MKSGGAEESTLRRSSRDTDNDSGKLLCTDAERCFMKNSAVLRGKLYYKGDNIKTWMGQHGEYASACLYIERQKPDNSISKHFLYFKAFSQDIVSKLKMIPKGAFIEIVGNLEVFDSKTYINAKNVMILSDLDKYTQEIEEHVKVRDSEEVSEEIESSKNIMKRIRDDGQKLIEGLFDATPVELERESVDDENIAVEALTKTQMDKIRSRGPQQVKGPTDAGDFLRTFQREMGSKNAGNDPEKDSDGSKKGEEADFGAISELIEALDEFSESAGSDSGDDDEDDKVPDGDDLFMPSVLDAEPKNRRPGGSGSNDAMERWNSAKTKRSEEGDRERNDSQNRDAGREGSRSFRNNPENSRDADDPDGDSKRPVSTWGKKSGHKRSFGKGVRR